MKFEIIHNEITLILSLSEEKEFIPSDRFHRLGTQTMIALKKNQIAAYSLDIKSTFKNETAQFYFNSVLLSTDENEIMGDLEEYIQNEEILENIVEYWKKYFDTNPYPIWKK